MRINIDYFFQLKQFTSFKTITNIVVFGPPRSKRHFTLFKPCLADTILRVSHTTCAFITLSLSTKGTGEEEEGCEQIDTPFVFINHHIFATKINSEIEPQITALPFKCEFIKRPRFTDHGSDNVVRHKLKCCQRAKRESIMTPWVYHNQHKDHQNSTSHVLDDEKIT